MSIVKKIVSAVLVMAVVFFVGLIFLVRANGKAIIEERATLMFHRPVTVGEVRLAFPLVLHVTDMNVEGLLWVDRAKVSCDLRNFFGKDFRFADVRLTNPILTIHRSANNQILWAEHANESSSPAPVSVENDGNFAIKMNAVVDHLMVTNGQIHFPTHSNEDGKAEVSVNNVRLIAHNVPLSGQELDVRFELEGTINGENVPLAGGQLVGSGSINWPRRNMDAVFKVANPDGIMDVQVILVSRNNDMTVRGHLKTRRSDAQTPRDETSFFGNVLLDAVQSTGVGMDLDFTFPMKMDQWELRNIDFSGNLNAAIEGK